MSNAIKTLDKFTFVRSDAPSENVPSKEFSVTTTSGLCDIKTQIVGTTHEVVTAGDITDTCFLRIYNMSSTATISVGADSTGSFVKWFDIGPGDPPGQLPRAGAIATTYVKSSAANTEIRLVLAKIAS